MIGDQIINPEMARALQVDACRVSSLVGWAVMQVPDYPDKFVARLMSNRPTNYVLVADSLA